jgi:hypothetical protein
MMNVLTNARKNAKIRWITIDLIVDLAGPILRPKNARNAKMEKTGKMENMD